MKKGLRVVAMVACIAMAVCCVGCGNNGGGDGTKITWWERNDVSAYLPNGNNDIKAFQMIAEQNGIELEFMHPMQGEQNNQFNVMIASGDLPDIVCYEWAGYQGGADRAIADGVIIALDEYIAQGKLPNYKKALEENGVMDLVKTPNGHIAGFHGIKGDLSMNASFGPTIRKDWLDKLGMEVPTTIDEWEKVLVAFRDGDPNGNGKKDEMPLTAVPNFYGAFGLVYENFYVSPEGEFTFTNMGPRYKAFLETMNRWYEMGLINPEYPTMDTKTRDSYITGDIAGAYVGYTGSQYGNYIAAKKDDPEFKLVGTPWPKGEEGVAWIPALGFRRVLRTAVAAISAKSKNIDAALKLLDSFYSEENTELLNWGIEGETYEKTADGNKFKDEILHNAEGKGPIAALAPYAIPSIGWYPRVSDPVAIRELTLPYPEMQEAAALWSSGDPSLLNPQSFALNAEESEEYMKLASTVQTYCAEMNQKFITGQESLDNYDKYEATLKDLKIDRLIEIYKGAYDRMNGK
ncbi:MAG: extracellular solute-binding protein [Clostridia bacterium]|nr:extracellular solute-binding protein [Clostridia bacterium]